VERRNVDVDFEKDFKLIFVGWAGGWLLVTNEARGRRI